MTYIWVLCVRRMDNRPVRGHDCRADHVVDDQSSFACQIAIPASDGEPGPSAVFAQKAGLSLSPAYSGLYRHQ